MGEFDSFMNFVNNELPKRLSTSDNPLSVAAKKVPISTGIGLGITFVDPATLKSDVLDLDKVDNTADADKPVSLATLEALDNKLDKGDVRSQVIEIITSMGFVVEPVTGDVILDEGSL